MGNVDIREKERWTFHHPLSQHAFGAITFLWEGSKQSPAPNSSLSPSSHVTEQCPHTVPLPHRVAVLRCSPRWGEGGFAQAGTPWRRCHPRPGITAVLLGKLGYFTANTDTALCSWGESRLKQSKRKCKCHLPGQCQGWPQNWPRATKPYLRAGLWLREVWMSMATFLLYAVLMAYNYFSYMSSACFVEKDKIPTWPTANNRLIMILRLDWSFMVCPCTEGRVLPNCSSGELCKSLFLRYLLSLKGSRINPTKKSWGLPFPLVSLVVCVPCWLTSPCLSGRISGADTAPGCSQQVSPLRLGGFF